MLTAVRWVQARLFYVKLEKSYYVQFNEEVIYKVNKDTAISLGAKLQLEIKEVNTINGIQDEKSA